MDPFTKDELVTATALLVSGIINFEPDDNQVTVRQGESSVYHTDSGHNSGPALITKLELTKHFLGHGFSP